MHFNICSRACIIYDYPLTVIKLHHSYGLMFFLWYCGAQIRVVSVKSAPKESKIYVTQLIWQVSLNVASPPFMWHGRCWEISSWLQSQGLMLVATEDFLIVELIGLWSRLLAFCLMLISDIILALLKHFKWHACIHAILGLYPLEIFLSKMIKSTFLIRSYMKD